MICEKCGQEVQEGNLFCTSCGATAGQAAPPPLTPPQAAAPPPPAGAPVPPVAGPPPAPPGMPAPPTASVPPAAPPPGAPLPLATPKSKKGLTIALISVAAVAVIAAVVLVLVFVVFSGDTGKAKDLMEKGDARMEKLQASGDELGTALAELVGSSSDIASAAEYEAAADDIRAQLKVVSDSLKEAQKDYKGIQGLKGVGDYEEYAGIVLELIDSNFEIVREVNVFLDYLGEQFAAVEAGQAVDTQAISDTTDAFGETLHELGGESDALEKKALELQKKNL